MNYSHINTHNKKIFLRRKVEKFQAYKIFSKQLIFMINELLMFKKVMIDIHSQKHIFYSNIRSNVKEKKAHVFYVFLNIYFTSSNLIFLSTCNHHINPIHINFHHHKNANLTISFDLIRGRNDDKFQMEKSIVIMWRRNSLLAAKSSLSFAFRGFANRE